MWDPGIPLSPVTCHVVARSVFFCFDVLLADVFLFVTVVNNILFAFWLLGVISGCIMQFLLRIQGHLGAFRFRGVGVLLFCGAVLPLGGLRGEADSPELQSIKELVFIVQY